MTRFILRFTAALGVAVLSLSAFGLATRSSGQEGAASPDLGVDVATLSPVIDNPYVAFASLKRAVYEGKERDLETGKTVKVRVEVTVRDTAETVAGVKVTVVEVRDYDDGELVEETLDYYAQDSAGVVYYIGERVDDVEGGQVVGHEGQWMAGEQGARVGVFMPATPQVGAVFEQERAPGVAEDRSKVVAVGKAVKVAAGTFKECIETEDFDPIGKTTMRKIYCRGVGLVREQAEDRSLGLVQRAAR